jgi:hypothetical protein
VVVASANLELVRSIYEAWERGDYSSADWAHPEIEWVIADGPAPGSWKGLAGMVEGWRDFLSTWEEYRAEVDEYIELDAERVLVLNHWSGRGKKSGLQVGQIRTRAAHLRPRSRWQGDQERHLHGQRARPRRPRPRSGGRLRGDVVA